MSTFNITDIPGIFAQTNNITRIHHNTYWWIWSLLAKKKKGINGLQRCSVKLHEEKKAKEVKKEFTDILLQTLIEYLLGRLKNKPHQVAAHSAAPDKSAKRMCQSVNRFSNSPLMYPWVCPGCLSCVKPPTVIECSKMKVKASITTLQPHPMVDICGETFNQGICTLLVCK